MILATAPRIDGEENDYHKPCYYHPGCKDAFDKEEDAKYE